MAILFYVLACSKVLGTSHVSLKNFVVSPFPTHKSLFDDHITQNQVFKKIITAIHFLSLLGIFVSVIFAPAKCQYVIVTAAVTFVVSIIIPPKGMLKPDEAAPDWLEKHPATLGGKSKKA